MEENDITSRPLYRALQALDARSRDRTFEALTLLQDSGVTIHGDWQVKDIWRHSARLSEVITETGASTAQRWGDEAKARPSEHARLQARGETYDDKTHAIKEGYQLSFSASYDWSRTKRTFTDLLQEWQEKWQEKALHEGQPTTTEAFLKAHSFRHPSESLADYMNAEEFESMKNGEKAPGKKMAYVLAEAIPKDIIHRRRSFLIVARHSQKHHPEPEESIETEKELPPHMRQRMTAYQPGSWSDKIRSYRLENGWSAEEIMERFNEAVLRRDPDQHTLNMVNVNKFEHGFSKGNETQVQAFADIFQLEGAEREDFIRANERQFNRQFHPPADLGPEIRLQLNSQDIILHLSADSGFSPAVIAGINSGKRVISRPLAQKIAPHLREEGEENEAVKEQFLQAVEEDWKEKIDNASPAGEKLKHYRLRAGMSLRNAGKAAGLSQTRVQQLEEQPHLHPDQLRHFISAYGLSTREAEQLHDEAQKDWEAHHAHPKPVVAPDERTSSRANIRQRTGPENGIHR